MSLITLVLRFGGSVLMLFGRTTGARECRTKLFDCVNYKIIYLYITK